MKAKICTCCKETKPVTEFWKNYKVKAHHQPYRSHCKICMKAAAKNRQRRHYLENKDTYLERRQKQYKADKAAAYKQMARWRRENAGKVNGWTARRRADMDMRTPSWADLEAINFFYECRPHGCHVDHIAPLRGKNISGFHVETNLQWLPARDNIVKRNSWN